MQYKVVFSERAKKQLTKLDKHISALIIGWLEKNIQNCDNPRAHGKALVGDKSGQRISRALITFSDIPKAVA